MGHNFRTGTPTSKFKDAEEWFRKGAMFLVSGTVQKRDGFNRIIRAKFKLAEEGEEEEKEKRYRPFIKVVENKSQGTTRREMEKHKRNEGVLTSYRQVRQVPEVLV